MAIHTSWVAPPNVIGGLDHIGTQGPCILIYSQLLPGITNVTDRARYYSFYPWLIWSYEQRDTELRDYNAFLDAYRKADCLFTMIAERHARVMGDDPARHGPAMVGRDALNKGVDLVGEGESVNLSTYAIRDESRQRYFANRLGGLGQYYAGTLTQLEILKTVEKPWLKYTHERGEPIARAFSSSVDGDAFWRAVDADTISAKTLDKLKDFCPCCLPSRQSEQGTLLDIFFDRKSQFEEEGVQRRKSLALVLHLAGALEDSGASHLDEPSFRAATYTRTLADGSTWSPPDTLANTLSGWAYYVRNDVLSVATQEAFGISLAALAEEPAFPATIEQFGRSLAGRPAVLRALGTLKAATFGQLCDLLRSSAPALSDFSSPEHELSWATARLSRQRLETAPGFLASVVQVLAMLRMRENKAAPAYGNLVIDQGQLKDSPINLLSFRQRCEEWDLMPLVDVVADLVTWVLETHLRVALRKLRQSSTATFRIQPTERGIERRNDIPPPAKTNPRFRQAVRILRDLGVLKRLWEDCSLGAKEVLRGLNAAEGYIPTTGLPGRDVSQLIDRGFAQQHGSRLQRPCLLLQRYLADTGDEGNALQRLFSTEVPFLSNSKAVLEHRLSHMDGLDRNLRRSLQHGIDDLPEHPDNCLTNIRNIVERVLELIWAVELENKHIPSDWFDTWNRNGERGHERWNGQFPVNLGHKVRLLNFMTGTERSGPVARYVKRTTYALVAAAQGFGDAGQHPDGAGVHPGAAYAAMTVCVELAAELKRRLPAA